MHLGCMNANLLHSNPRYILATKMAIFKVMRMNTNTIIMCRSHSMVKSHIIVG